MEQPHAENQRDKHLFGPGPKSILSLDGGGVRGIIALAFLERIEELLRDRNGGDRSFRLCNHFDLVGGTSSGAIIATGLALGFSVEQLVKTYLELSHRAFQGSRWHGGVFVPKFRTAPLFEEIRRQIGSVTLGSETVRTGLAIFAKRIDTGSPWVFHNNPRSRYFHPPQDDPEAMANSKMELAEILRASTAAPTYFEPEDITVANGVEGLFVDGGVSPFNNPALMLLMMATSGSYGYGWPTGLGNLSLISIGTGLHSQRYESAAFKRSPGLVQAMNALRSLVADNMWQAQAILQWLGASSSAWQIDGEAGTLIDETPVSEPLLRYERLDLSLESDWLTAELGERISNEELNHLREIDLPEMASRLLELGRKAARKQVKAKMFN